MFDVLAPECHDHWRQFFDRLMQGEQADYAEATFLTRDGRRVFVEGNLSCSFKDGKPVGTRGFFRDITKRKQAEAALRTVQQRREQLENIVSRSPAVAFLWRTDERLTVDFVSSNVSQLGYEPEEFLSGRLHYADIIHSKTATTPSPRLPGTSLPGQASTCRNTGCSRRRAKCAGLRTIPGCRAIPTAAVTHHQGIIVDITERKRPRPLCGERTQVPPTCLKLE